MEKEKGVINVHGQTDRQPFRIKCESQNGFSKSEVSLRISSMTLCVE